MRPETREKLETFKKRLLSLPIPNDDILKRVERLESILNSDEDRNCDIYKSENEARSAWHNFTLAGLVHSSFESWLFEKRTLGLNEKPVFGRNATHDEVSEGKEVWCYACSNDACAWCKEDRLAVCEDAEMPPEPKISAM